MKVVINSHFGGGWSTWQEGREQQAMMLFDEQLIRAIENKDAAEFQGFQDRFAAGFGSRPFGMGGLKVVEVTGPFRIREYDGLEQVVTWEEDRENWWNW